MEEKCGIYKVTNKINNKVYIGKSKHIFLRWRQHHTEPFNVGCKMYDSIFYRAIRKYGIDEFSFEIIDECDESQLNEREKYWINKYHAYMYDIDSNGYNMTRGGETTWQELQYDIDLIKQLWNEGKTHQEIYEITGYSNQIITRYLNYLDIPINERLQRSNLYKAKEVHQYKLNGMYIQSYTSVSDAVRELQKNNIQACTSNICYACNGKLSSAYGYIWSYEKKELLKKKIKHSKVDQYDLNGQYITTYNTITEAAKKNNIKHISSITNVCTGKSKTAGGYIWKYNI